MEISWVLCQSPISKAASISRIKYSAVLLLIFVAILVDSWGLFGLAKFFAESLAVCHIPKDI
jgi:hypothetical protein